MIKAVIFDLDGTLLNTLKDLNEALNYSVGKYGYEKISIEKTREFIGNGIKNLILKAINYDETKIDEIFYLFKEYYSANCNNYTMPYDGILELIKILKNDYKLGIVSNKAKYGLDILVNAHFKNDFKVVIGDMEGIPRKPSKEPLVEACRRLNVSIDEMVYIGDSDVDVLTVKNTGCHGIFVDYGFRDRDKLILAGANIIISNPLDIVKTLKELN